MNIAEYVSNSEKLPVSPIWGGKRAFHFLCLGHLEFSKAMGFELERVSPQLTVVREGQMCGEEQLKRLIRERKFDYSYFDREIENVARLKGESAADGGLWGGGCFGPLTVVSGILGAENMLKLIVKKPEFVCRFVEYVTEFMVELAVREGKEGMEFFWVAEPLASLLSPKNFWTFSGRYLKRIYQSTEAPGFLHVCGKTLKHTLKLAETGAKVLSIDFCTDIRECIRMVDKEVVIMGNVSPPVLRFGTVEEVRQEVEKILDDCRGFRNFVLSTGCSIMEGTPDENMKVLFDMAETCIW